MINPKNKKRKTITISQSMDIESFFYCKEHKIKFSILVEALLLSYLWNNQKLIKIIQERTKDDKSKK